jgi:uncharacterized membrane protein
MTTIEESAAGFHRLSIFYAFSSVDRDSLYVICTTEYYAHFARSDACSPRNAIIDGTYDAGTQRCDGTKAA